MKKLLSFLMFLFLIGVIIYIFLKAPVFNKIISCYDQTRISFDDAEYGSRAQGWSQYRLCQMKHDNVVVLERCLIATADADQTPGNVYDFVIPYLPTMHPGIKDLKVVKHDINNECIDYPSTLFDL
jgi:hypothetical protein